MAKGSRGRQRIASRQYKLSPYPLTPCKRDICEDMCPKKCSKALDKKELEDVTCSVCMEYPHNAVLLLCSSHDKGCRPYMCGTSFRHSNCLDQYKKAYTKVISSQNGQPMQDSISNPGVLEDSKSEVTELACPLCRGQVKGWTVVEPVRDYLNAKKRTCMQDNCSFVGNYKELRKHVRAEHPSARPREVDPDHEQKWRWLEWEREREDVISTVTSTMPGAVVFGDYVIEGRHNDFDTDDEQGAGGAERNGRFQMGIEAMNFFLLLHAVRHGNNDLGNLSRWLRSELTPNHVAGQKISLASWISQMKTTIMAARTMKEMKMAYLWLVGSNAMVVAEFCWADPVEGVDVEMHKQGLKVVEDCLGNRRLEKDKSRRYILGHSHYKVVR